MLDFYNLFASFHWQFIEEGIQNRNIYTYLVQSNQMHEDQVGDKSYILVERSYKLEKLDNIQLQITTLDFLRKTAQSNKLREIRWTGQIYSPNVYFFLYQELIKYIHQKWI